MSEKTKHKECVKVFAKLNNQFVKFKKCHNIMVSELITYLENKENKHWDEYLHVAEVIDVVKDIFGKKEVQL